MSRATGRRRIDARPRHKAKRLASRRRRRRRFFEFYWPAIAVRLHKLLRFLRTPFIAAIPSLLPEETKTGRVASGRIVETTFRRIALTNVELRDHSTPIMVVLFETDVAWNRDVISASFLSYDQLRENRFFFIFYTNRLCLSIFDAASFNINWKTMNDK